MEKFALLNLLSALNSLTAKPSDKQTGATANTENVSADTAADAVTAFTQTAPASANVQQNTYPNVMASVLERHEAISNRIKNKK